MLELTIKPKELFDEATQRFIKSKEVTLKLEHSLLSISKWESIFRKPFLKTSEGLTSHELLSYIQCMTINTPPVDVYQYIDKEELDIITNYILEPKTATTFSGQSNKPNRQIITSELIYYYLVAFEIPFEVEKWHIDRLLTLVRICSIKQEEAMKTKKGRPHDQLINNKRLNEERKELLGTKG